MHYSKCLSVALLLSLNTSAYSATNQTEIELNFTHTPFVNLVGTAPGSNRMYDNNYIADWIFPVNVDLGTLGLASNILGGCGVNFSTANNFDLLHTVSGASLTQYKVLYHSQEFGINTNPTLSIPCNTVPTAIQFRPTGIVFGNFWEAGLIESGIYRDIINVVVTTQ